MKDNQNLTNDFQQAGKIENPACKTMRVSTKHEETFENFQENFELFGSKSLLKIDFFLNFY